MEPSFFASTNQVDVFDFVEVKIRLHNPVADPFRTVLVEGTFARGVEDPVPVIGFCDTQDGSTHRIRFMPTECGDYSYRITITTPETSASYEGSFHAINAGRKGLLMVDPEHGYHFQWSGTGEHFFWNAATAYFMMGCPDPIIAESIDRLASKQVNRIRTTLNSCRVPNAQAWKEAVYTNEEFTFMFGPWLSARPEAVGDPGWDVTRFDIAFWQKYDRLVARARQHDIIVSVVFYIDGYRPGAYPFDLTKSSEHYGLDEDELRYYRYAAARLSAYSNVEWCVSNEWHLFRGKPWVRAMGQYLSKHDPYGHLMSVHGDEEFSFRTEKWAKPWADFAVVQAWDSEAGYDAMMENRRLQDRTGRKMPQVVEEYCYEDHYPDGLLPPLRSADSRRRIAWEVSMAGCYQATGESARNGLGGWLNGRGDESMTMLDLYGHMKKFFEAFAWWRLEPHPELAPGAMCLAEPGVRYVVYLTNASAQLPDVDTVSGYAQDQLAPRPEFTQRLYNPRTGQYTQPFSNFLDRTVTDSHDDWVLLIERQNATSLI